MGEATGTPDQRQRPIHEMGEEPRTGVLEILRHLQLGETVHRIDHPFRVCDGDAGETRRR
jgi:hypothetical protein